jgi:hypothetical protein
MFVRQPRPGGLGSSPACRDQVGDRDARRCTGPETGAHRAIRRASGSLRSASEDRDADRLAIAAEEGLAFIHPYNDPNVIAGQGTAGLEIAADCAALGIAPDAVVVPCSGGGSRRERRSR